MRLRWLIIALVLSTLLLATHVVALDRFLYWHFPPLDIPMHLLAGVVIGTAVIGVLGRKRPLVFMGSVIAGILGWEVFEYIAVISPGQPDYVRDTVLDVALGLLGALSAYGLAHLTLWRSR